MNIDTAKRTVRERVWASLDAAKAVAPPGAAGHIPTFIGADFAAERLASLAIWQQSRVIKSNPDQAQLPVRQCALDQNKLVYMAVPKIASLKPFYLLDPQQHGREVAESNQAAQLVPTVGLDEMEPVDLVICGTVAVDRRGTRVGKGAGYSDIEVALLIEAGLVGPKTIIVTTVHPLQIVDEDLPETDHDFSVDLIVTPDEVIECGPARRPAGILWEDLSPAKVAAIPVLRARWTS